MASSSPIIDLAAERVKLTRSNMRIMDVVVHSDAVTDLDANALSLGCLHEQWAMLPIISPKVVTPSADAKAMSVLHGGNSARTLPGRTLVCSYVMIVAMHAIDLNGQPLNLHFTLDCGQAFRWRKRDDDVWRGVVRDKLVALAVRDNVLYWHTYPEDDLALVQDYLRLDRDVNSIYAALSAADPHLKEVIKRFHGLRLLRQDPVETLLSFVCTAANNIPKVKRTIEELAQCQKQLVCENECAFPDPEALAAIEAMNVRSLVPQLGFRAKYLCAAAKYVADRGPEWLSGLRKASYEEALAELMRIKGIGRKIADCICLFALDKDEAVPVDTHVKQIAQRLFIPNLEAKALGPKVYASIVGAFHERYGPFAGWAQQFLFYEDLCKANGR